VDSLSLSKLQIKNFRNIEDQIISFSKGINCILGDNGNGKTNILEAIYYLAYRKSFRKKNSFPQLLSVDGEKPEILFSSVFNKNNEEEVFYSGRLNSDESTWFLNGKTTKSKLPIKVVFINPFDSFLFFSQASFRRTWFDQYISLIDPLYKQLLSNYTKALKSRNIILSKRPSLNNIQLDVYETEMNTYGVQITKKRIEFLHSIEEYLSATFKKLFSIEHHLSVELSTKCQLNKDDALSSILKKNREVDVQAGRSTYGIHLDDYTLLFDNFNSIDYCSLGQQKMSYLGLLFAYIELFGYKFGSFPIVLIDDVSGELDRVRWENLVNYLDERNFQVLITTANENFKSQLEKISESKKMVIVEGRVIQ
jgi:DNA replication and repair protein RecF